MCTYYLRVACVRMTGAVMIFCSFVLIGLLLQKITIKREMDFHFKVWKTGNDGM